MHRNSSLSAWSKGWKKLISTKNTIKTFPLPKIWRFLIERGMVQVLF